MINLRNIKNTKNNIRIIPQNLTPKEYPKGRPINHMDICIELLD